MTGGEFILSLVTVLVLVLLCTSTGNVRRVGFYPSSQARLPSVIIFLNMVGPKPRRRVPVVPPSRLGPARYGYHSCFSGPSYSGPKTSNCYTIGCLRALPNTVHAHCRS